MKNPTLKTVYSEKLNKSAPLSEYPRPNFKRDSYISLNGEWVLDIKGEDGNERSFGITVPFPPESLLSGIEQEISSEDTLCYKRSFNIPEGFVKSRVILHFDAVDGECTVYINGALVGSNDCGYIPFSFDITDHLKEGDNELSVNVRDELSHIFPYGKQKRARGGMWYTPVSGIWQSVWLESLPASPINGIKITPTEASVKISVDTAAAEKRITLTESGEVFEFTGSEIEIRPSSIKPWSPESPYLYYFTLETETDRIESYFALRRIDIKTADGVPRICLNGRPYLAHGLLDQGYFPDGIFTPASYEAYEDDIKAAKSLGFNMLRKHIKIEPPMFYHLCDKLGMLVFQDMINNSDYSFIRDTALPTVGLKRLPDRHMHKNKRSREIFKREMLKTADHLYNFPSVVYYTIFNEGWGQFCADEMYDILKKKDPTRVIDATSGWFWQKKSDVMSHHVYFKKLKTKIHRERPTVISEFGGYSHRVDGHLFGTENYGYKTYDDAEDFEAAVMRLYESEVMPLVKNGVSALVYTQIYDIEDETNGFLTYDRKVMKVNAERFKKMSKRLTERNTKEG